MSTTEWIRLQRDNPPQEGIAVLFFIINMKGHFVVMTGHQKKNNYFVFDVYENKFRRVPKAYKIIWWRVCDLPKKEDPVKPPNLQTQEEIQSGQAQLDSSE